MDRGHAGGIEAISNEFHGLHDARGRRPALHGQTAKGVGYGDYERARRTAGREDPGEPYSERDEAVSGRQAARYSFHRVGWTRGGFGEADGKGRAGGVLVHDMRAMYRGDADGESGLREAPLSRI